MMSIVSRVSAWLAVAALGVMIVTLASCSTGRPVEQAPAADDRLERTNRAAHAAFARGRYFQAAGLYRKSIDLAYERDDVQAVIDAQFNTAVCLVRLGKVDEAADLVESAKAELERADRPEPVELRLLEVAVLYRQSKFEEATANADKIIAMAPGSESARRAQFLRGLIAAELGDAARLKTDIAGLGAPADNRLKADRMELIGHLAILERRYAAAVTAFTDAAHFRSATSDYRGIVRAMAMAGEASELAGQPGQASVQFLRAGRSALHQGAHSQARDLLTRSRRLAEVAGDEQTAGEATKYLSILDETEAS